MHCASSEHPITQEPDQRVSSGCNPGSWSLRDLRARERKPCDALARHRAQLVGVTGRRNAVELRTAIDIARRDRNVVGNNRTVLHATTALRVEAAVALTRVLGGEL